MQFLNLPHANDAGSGALPSLTPQAGEATKESQDSSFSIILAEGNQGDARSHDVPTAEDILLVGGALSLATPTTQATSAMTPVDIQLSEEALGPVLKDMATQHTSFEAVKEIEVLSSDAENLMLPKTGPDQGPEVGLVERQENGFDLRSKSGGVLIPTDVAQGVSQIEQSVTLRAALESQKTLAPNPTSAAEPHLTQVSQVDSDASAELRVQKIQNSASMAPKDGLIQDLPQAMTPVTPQPHSFQGAAPDSPFSSLDQRDSSISKIPVLGASASGVEPILGHQGIPERPDSNSSSSQGLAIVSPLDVESSGDGLPIVELDTDGIETHKSTENTQPVRTPPAQVHIITPSPTPPVSIASIAETIVEVSSGDEVEGGIVDSERFDTPVSPSPTETVNQTTSAPTAADRNAALYSGMVEGGSSQLAAAEGVQVQDFETTSLYGRSDAISVQEQLSQLDPLTQTSRIELPARLAAQIADVARQLPDGPIEISLSPEELGKVKLTFQVSENGAMNVVVAAERAETLELMRRNVDSLLAEFSDLGYEGSSFQFQQDDQSGSGENADQSGETHAGVTTDTADGAHASKTDTHVPSPVRLHLDGASGMDLRL